ncbi:MAG TPA: TonB-dependent receptor [Caulobacteraceae bacterium]|nr:TonB-dependent receptor [Caulobacteraceae bacterium]
MRFHGLLAVVLCSGAALGALPTASLAQQTADPSAAAPTSWTVSEAIVHARRIGEDQQKVPVAVTAITPQRLQEDTVVQVEDLQRNAPSLEIDPGSLGGSADPRFTVRGLSGELVTDPSVVVYFDEVPTDPRNIAYAMYDLGSVDVLRGPQGTLFGKNSTGGAVVFETARPAETFGGWIDGRWGRFDDRELSGAINLPLGPMFAARVAADIERRDGTVQSLTGGPRYNDRNHESARLELSFKPGETFRNLLEASVYRVRQINNLPILTAVAPCTVSAGGPAPICLFSSATGVFPFLPPEVPTNFATGAPDLAAELATQQTLGIDKTVNAYRAPFWVDYDAATDIASLKLGVTTLENIAHLDWASYTTGFDFTGTGSGLLDQSSRQKAHNFSDELHLLGATPQVTWIVGAFYSGMRGGEADVFDLVNYPGNPLLGFPPNPLSPQTVSISAPQDSTAFFGHLTWYLPAWTHGVSLTGGYRHTWDERSFTQQRLQPGNPLLGVPTCALLGFPGVDPNTCVEHLSKRFSAGTYDASINWQASPDALLYLATRRGYKAGGFNFASTDPGFVSYAPEYVRDVELGLKTDFRIGPAPVRANFALYRAGYDNIQAQFILIGPSGLPEAVIVNQDPVTGAQNKATLEGGEAEVTIDPVRQLRVDADFGYAQGRYDQFTSEQQTGPISLAGQQIAGIPHTTLRVGLDYSPDVPDRWGKPTFSASLYNRSSQSANSLNPTLIKGFTTVDLRLDWRNLGGRPVDLAFYGSNVTNSRHVVIANDLTDVIGISSAQWSEPATYGVELRYRFGANAGG